MKCMYTKLPRIKVLYLLFIGYIIAQRSKLQTVLIWNGPGEVCPRDTPIRHIHLLYLDSKRFRFEWSILHFTLCK